MAMIEVKYDPALQLEPIVDVMYSTSKTENPDEKQSPEQQIDQTKVVGIATPLIAFNGDVVHWADIRSFYLTCDNFLPRVSIIANDSLGFIKGTKQPQPDNLLRIQIIPPFDNAYKKVDLMFYVTSFKFSGSTMHIDAIYNVPELRNCRLEAYGQISTYELIDRIAKVCQLGLASNIESTDDKRWVYCQNENYIDIIKKEIRWGGAEHELLDCWVDWHNYVNIVNIYERFNTIDSDLKVWVTNSFGIDTEAGTEVQPIQTDSVISNNPALRRSPLYINNYTPLMDTKNNVLEGTDRVVEIYMMDNMESNSTLIQDGDSHNDIFTKMIYGGENFGDFNYILQKSCRDMFMKNLNNQMILVELSQPVLGLERGGKVQLEWYDTNNLLNDIKEKHPIETNTPVSDEEIEMDKFNINKQVSGQYYIMKTELKFNGVQQDSTGWRYRLYLCRPQDQINTYK